MGLAAAAASCGLSARPPPAAFKLLPVGDDETTFGLAPSSCGGVCVCSADGRLAVAPADAEGVVPTRFRLRCSSDGAGAGEDDAAPTTLSEEWTMVEMPRDIELEGNLLEIWENQRYWPLGGWRAQLLVRGHRRHSLLHAVHSCRAAPPPTARRAHAME